MLLRPHHRLITELPALLLLLFTSVLLTEVNAVADSGSQSAGNQITSVVNLQPFKTVQSAEIHMPDGNLAEVTLINLNSNINQWYILQLSDNHKKVVEEYHLENPYPHDQRLTLNENSQPRLALTRKGVAVKDCSSLQLIVKGELETARKSRQIYAPLCNGNIFLRNPTRGHQTTIETVTGFLRDRLPGGESVVGFVKDNFFKDAFLEKAQTKEASHSALPESEPGLPAPADINPDFANQLIFPAGLGLQLKRRAKGVLTGQWYSVQDNPGIFVSLIQPKAIAPAILNSHRNRVNRLDNIESGALAYLIAFDLDRFDLGFTIGTEHPRVGWSNRTRDSVKIKGIPGPDGIETIAPIVANGMISPVDSVSTVATFTGGFKRAHGAFKYGAFAERNRGSHYGFIERGVVLSTLQPELATVLVYDDGTVALKTWSEEDNVNLDRIVHARQNGVPILEWDSESQQPVPGSLVAKWGAGNWSGSHDMKLRTLRSGAALQDSGGKRFLIYGYFSTATPSAMARVFQAYGCSYALHLDMNALEHTYLALYRQKESHLAVQHLIQGMSVLDKTRKGAYIPRFIGYPDNRDFFYLMRRD
ncbi:hypothetical protein [Desulfosediminicola sp.]|uniref:hypothetical protein n=1 Tax=Desulfosediminicola sp. TaxID=2886825 RepID=UPI003AF2CE3E